jgi:membrane protease YdiL (CAAX protease family)
MTGLRTEIGEIVGTVAVTPAEDASTIRRRRIVVVIVLAIGAALLGFSLTRKPGDASFYWLTLALAAVWAVGALGAGALPLGSVQFRGRDQRPVIAGTVIGLLVGGAFVVGGLVAREIPPVRNYVVSVLEFTSFGALWLVVLITVVNGVAEEMFFRGSLYTALGRFHPEVVSTLVYAIAVLATGNPMLGFAGIVLGGVCAFERRITGGVLAPMLTHFFWGLVMVLALPPVFGV